MSSSLLCASAWFLCVCCARCYRYIGRVRRRMTEDDAQSKYIEVSTHISRYVNCIKTYHADGKLKSCATCYENASILNAIRNSWFSCGKRWILACFLRFLTLMTTSVHSVAMQHKNVKLLLLSYASLCVIGLAQVRNDIGTRAVSNRVSTLPNDFA